MRRHVHANREIEPFDVRSANSVIVGIAEPCCFVDAGYRGRAVARFRLAAGIGFHELGEVDPRSHVQRYVMRIQAESVAGHLCAADSGVVETSQERDASMLRLACQPCEPESVCYRYRWRTTTTSRPLRDQACEGWRFSLCRPRIPIARLARYASRQRSLPPTSRNASQLRPTCRTKSQIVSRFMPEIRSASADRHSFQEHAENRDCRCQVDSHIA